jgi:histidine ammonia-lyase
LRQNPKLILGKGTGEAYRIIRETVDYQAGDAWWGPEIEAVKGLILSNLLEIPE